MNEPNRAGVMALQLVVVVATLGATFILFFNPACIECMLTEVARGIAAGLLFSALESLVMVSRPMMVRKPMTCWFRHAFSLLRREIKCGLVAGYLLGLVLAMWERWGH